MESGARYLWTEEALIEYPQEDKQRHFIRRTKEEMVTLEGNPLYPIRKTDTLSYDLSPGAVSEQALYDRVYRLHSHLLQQGENPEPLRGPFRHERISTPLGQFHVGNPPFS